MKSCSSTPSAAAGRNAMNRPIAKRCAFSLCGTAFVTFHSCSKIDHADRQDRAELDEDLEHLARRRVEAQQLLHQDHVARSTKRAETR